jgi:hypothetical protein
MALADSPPERYRQVSGLFTQRVLGALDWDALSPVAGWTARDVVRHLTARSTSSTLRTSSCTPGT